MSSAFDELLNVAVELWEGRTGRNGSFWYAAPETSMTKTLILMILEVRKELNELKNEKKEETVHAN